LKTKKRVSKESYYKDSNFVTVNFLFMMDIFCCIDESAFKIEIEIIFVIIFHN
jgi:hypothetical protein